MLTPARLNIGLGQSSDAGRKAENQDFFGAITPEGQALVFKGIALAIADGISSSQVSGQAAQTAVKSFLEDYYATPDTWSAETAGLKVIKAINAWLYQDNSRRTDPDKNHGLVTTFSAVIFKGREAHVFHVGDSRVYRRSADGLECLTRDHRYAASPSETYLSRALGIDETVDIDYRRIPLEHGDIFLLSTDGVHEALSLEDINAHFQTPVDDWDGVAAGISKAALDAGSSDNITLQIAQVKALPPETATDLLTGGQTLPAPSELRADADIDGLKIARQIHSSSRSKVFLAVNETGERFALKVPSSEMRENKQHLSRFLLEEWIANRVTSDHVLRAAKPPEQRSALYVLTEYFEGQTLRQWMADHPSADLETLRAIIEQIVSGARAFHRKDMLHQDLRPENILINPQGTVKIIDFGSVYVPGVEEAAPGTAGYMPGTFQYTAPEYLCGDAVSWRSDQFAIGVIAYEMLTGRLPYGTAVAKVATRTDQRRLIYTPARDFTPDAPLWMDAAIKRAVHPDPLQRFDALSEFVRDLRDPKAIGRMQRHIPLAQRSPAAFWKGVSAVLAVITLWLLFQLY